MLDVVVVLLDGPGIIGALLVGGGLGEEVWRASAFGLALCAVLAPCECVFAEAPDALDGDDGDLVAGRHSRGYSVALLASAILMPTPACVLACWRLCVTRVGFSLKGQRRTVAVVKSTDSDTPPSLWSVKYGILQLMRLLCAGTTPRCSRYNTKPARVACFARTA